MNEVAIETETKKQKIEKTYGQKTIEFYYKNPDTHTEQILWYLSYLNKKVWNIFSDVCRGNFEFIKPFIDQIPDEVKGKQEIKKIIETATIETKQDGSEYVKCATISEFTMNNLLSPIRNSDPELLSINLENLKKVTKGLSKSWKSFFKLRKGGEDKKMKEGDKAARPPGYKSPLYFFTLQWENPKLVLVDDVYYILIIHSIVGIAKILIPLPHYVSNLLLDKKVRYVTINRVENSVNKKSDFKINLVYETELVEKKIVTPISIIAGVDLGARRITIARSTEPLGQIKTYELRAYDKYFTRERKSVEARMKNKIKGSKSYEKMAEVITKNSAKWKNQQKTNQRKIALEIVNSADVFYIGDIAVRMHLAKEANKENNSDVEKSQHRGSQNTGNLARMVTYIKEKAIEQGKTVIMVEDYKPTGKNTKTMIKKIAAVRNMEIGIAHHRNMVEK